MSTLVTQSRNASLIASFRVRDAGRHRDDLGAEQPHPGHVERLPLGVDLAHVDHALEAEQRAAVAVATPCWPAPVSAMTRVLPIRFVSSAWPSTLLILCEPVWLRSSRLSRIRAPPASENRRRVGERRRAAGVVAQQPVRARSRNSGSARAVGVGRGQLVERGDQRLGDEPAAVRAEPAVAVLEVGGRPVAVDGSQCGRRVTARRMRAGGDQVGDRLARDVGRDQALADQHRVGAGRGVGEQVVRAADAGLGDLDHRRRDRRRDAGRTSRGRPRGCAGCGR